MLTATVAALLPAVACAQAYPTKLIRIVVPFPPGGSNDVLARIVEKILTPALGQIVIIENRPGASGLIGTEFVAKAPADGYVLLLMTSAFAINPSLYSKIPYDPIKDFEPVSALTAYPLLLLGHPSLPVRSVKALIALAKAQPGNLNYSSGGIGTSNHIAGALFAHMAGVRMTHIPYKGVGPALTELVGGQVHIIFGAPSSTLPFVRSGRLRALGVTGAKRFPLLPDAPTIAEAGVPGYEITSWTALFAPAGTPAAIVKRISAEVEKGLRQADALDVLQKLGLDLTAGTPEALAALIRTEVTKWAKVIKDTGIKPQ
ncbi:MAG: tripartite tricarboxylate transporter substrate binding protein [Betaproteobacteria bacterium]|nr:tripartite tricarboxylate transporter substrate binding protein [Betaproteobacteria bacterium]